MKNSTRHYQLALFKAHITAVLFGLTGVLGVLIESSAGVLVLGRVFIALVTLTLFLLYKKFTFVKLSLNNILLQFLLGSLLTAHWVTFYIAVKVGGVAVGTLGFASFPAFVCLFERLIFKVRLKLSEFFLLIAISLGLMLVTPSFEFSNQATQGLLWGIFSGAIYGLLAVLNRKNREKLSSTQTSWWQYLVGVMILLPFYAEHLPQVSLQDWLWIACIGLLCTSLAYTLFVSSLDVLNARTAAMIISLEPVYAILIAWLWLKETPTFTMILGGAIIILSVAIENLRKS